ncbi:MAG: dethiobiotin synthase [Nitrospirota bacterium]|nr:dethiobiotin synthase [Nitrospirota bacterium]
MKGFFITGTDTGVGKTIVAGGLIRALIFQGVKTAGMKPVESGCVREGNVLIPSDGTFLKQIAQMQELVTQVTPCCYEAPLAPLPASELEKKIISVSAIRKAFFKLYTRYDAVIVEGIGGIMVPLKDNYFVIDLAREIGLPLIVVAKPGLGSINHTMLTVKYALKEGLTVAGIIINYSHPPENSLAEETNPRLLKQICPVPIIGIFPYLKNRDDETIQQAALKNFDMEVINKYL